MTIYGLIRMRGQSLSQNKKSLTLIVFNMRVGLPRKAPAKRIHERVEGLQYINSVLRMFTNNRSLSIPSLRYAKSISSCEVPRLLRGTGGSGDEYSFKLIVSYPWSSGFLAAHPLTKKAKNFDKRCLSSYHGVSFTL